MMSGQPIRAARVLSEVITPEMMRRALCHLWEAAEEDDLAEPEERQEVHEAIEKAQRYADKLIDWRV